MTKTDLKKQIKAKHARVQRDNKTFGKMTKAQKRVKIAEDALSWMKTNIFRASLNNEYFNPNPPHSMDYDGRFNAFEKGHWETQLHDAILSQGEGCAGCVLGGLMFAKAMRFDDVKIPGTGQWSVGGDWYSGGYFDQDEVLNSLNNIFSLSQLSIIESAFEGTEAGRDVVGLSSRHVEKAIEFGDPFIGAQERFKAIMQNIIDNKGTFKP